MSEVVYDILIIGSGPAGLSASVNARIRNKSACILSGEIGSKKLAKAPWIDNYLGFEKIKGFELEKKFIDHATSSGVSIINENVVGIYNLGDTFGVMTSSSAVYSGKTVIIATGSIQKAFIKGEEKFLGQGVSYCATCDGPLYRGKKVAVLGYSQHSIKEANYLSEICSEVVFVPGSKDVSGNLEKLNSDVHVVNGEVHAIEGELKAENLSIADDVIPIEALFIIRDTVPVDKLIDGLELDNGNINVKPDMSTSIEGIFAAGDCTGKPYQIAKSVGEGLIAALSASEFIDDRK